MWFAWTSGRGAGRVKTSDVAALPVQTGAAIRHARQVHPTGVLANGTLARIAGTALCVTSSRGYQLRCAVVDGWVK